MREYSVLFEKQKLFYEKGISRNISYRKEQLQNLYKAIVQNEEKIYAALWKDLHKGSFEAYLTEIGIVLDEINFLISNLKKLSRPKRVRTPFTLFKAKSYVTSQAYGQVLIMAPWNYPFQLIVGPLAGAIAAGNTVILKPSELATATEAFVNELIAELFDEEYVACVMGDSVISQNLLNLKFDYIFFTGSPRVGKIIMTAAAKNLTPLTLELGGKSPVVVDETANIELAARRLTWGKFLNGGQTCIAPDYLLVHETVKNQLVDRIIFYIEKSFGKDPQKSPDYLRIINASNFIRLSHLLKNQKILTGGVSNEEEKYFSPTLIDEPAPDSMIMQEEIFGPILPVLSFKNIDEAINLVESKDKPLAMYIFSNSKKNQKKLLEGIHAGNGAINDVIMQFANPNLPFGGVGPSGMGAYHGKHSFATFSHQKSILIKSNLIDIPLRYPPYKKGYHKIVKALIK
ncbi:MAG: aldehyde dehydrogenase [Bacteroidales bacterium]|nr:aldehyde dehydrogenase [Bacteroidales bacterium]MCF8405947.1 aldehyde dehydrogenase [Bacteroidales bacterium]